jgi:hypothetical protein
MKMKKITVCSRLRVELRKQGMPFKGNVINKMIHLCLSLLSFFGFFIFYFYKMSQPTLQDNSQQSDSEMDYDEINMLEEDEDDWQDAEEQQQGIEVVPATSIRETAKKPDLKHTIDETELRRKIKEIQFNKDLDAREKARQIQVRDRKSRYKSLELTRTLL